MPLTDVERVITNTVAQRFLEQESTPRKELVLKFKPHGSNAVDRLVRLNILYQREQNREELLPHAIAFHYCGEHNTVHLAQSSLEQLIPALQRLYEDVGMERKLSTINIDAAVQHFHPHMTAPAIWLGLYLSQELGLIAGWAWDKKSTDIQNINLNERVINVDASNVWVNHVHSTAPR